MRVATFNAHDSARAVRRSLQLAGLVLWQEYPRQLQHQRGWRTFRAHAGNVAIGWRLRWWDYQGAEWHKAHGGRRRVTPERGTLVVKLVHRTSGTGVAVVDGHRINRTRGAWLAVPGIHARWRAERWAEHDQLDRQVVADLVDDGWVVIGGGDYNRRDVELPHPCAGYLTGVGSIDKLWATDLGGQLQLLDGGRIDDLGSDHPLRWARLAVRHG